MTEWTLYSESAPTAEGMYDWRLPSKATNGIVVQFPAKMRWRSAGFEKVLSPEFDWWDGWKVIVPAYTLWRPYSSDAIVIVDSDAIIACPFCKTVPKLYGHAEHGNGVLIPSSPYEYNAWWMECCEWCRTPIFYDPVRLIHTWNNKLTEHGTTP